MKTIINIIIATALLAVATSATAKSWRINNNAAAAPDFASINAAMSSADVLAGDTLYLDPGTSLSGDQTVTKTVTIVGPGYFRADTPHAFAYLQNTFFIYNWKCSRKCHINCRYIGSGKIRVIVYCFRKYFSVTF